MWYVEFSAIYKGIKYYMFKNSSCSHYHGPTDVLQRFCLPSHHVWGIKPENTAHLFHSVVIMVEVLAAICSQLITVPVYLSGERPFAKYVSMTKKSPRISDIHSIINLVSLALIRLTCIQLTLLNDYGLP